MEVAVGLGVGDGVGVNVGVGVAVGVSVGVGVKVSVGTGVSTGASTAACTSSTAGASAGCAAVGSGVLGGGACAGWRALIWIQRDGIDEDQIPIGVAAIVGAVVGAKENGNRTVAGPGADIDVHIWWWVIEHTPRYPVDWPPNDRWAVGVGAAGGVDAQLATKGIGRGWRSPTNASAITSARRYGDLGVDASLKRAARALDGEIGATKITMIGLVKGCVTGGNKLGPAIGHFPGRAAMK